MASQTKLVFPLPPPTTNSLTTQQRTQLLRKTKKLEQILGATPHLLDLAASEALAPVHVSLSGSEKSRRSFSYSRSSIDSFSSSSSCSSSPLPSPIERNSSLPSSLSRSSSTFSRKSDVPSRSPGSYDNWPANKPPFLRLAVTPPDLDTIPASPDHKSTLFSSSIHLRSPSIDGFDHNQYTISPQKSSSSQDFDPSPSFNITSMGSTRKSKMDRLRRKLGHGVPVDLVFPSSKESRAPPADELSSFVFPSPPRTPRPKKTAGTIAGTRDSVTESSIHLAPRQSVELKASRPPPSPPRLSSSSSSGKETLSAIIESPDEHGSGCSEEFGLVRHDSNRRIRPQWYGSNGTTEIKLWSTRRGYEGWAPPTPPKPVVHEGKRRSWSYRKPPPSIEV